MQATERFIPVELLTGNPLPERLELRSAPVKRVYPFYSYIYAPGRGLVQVVTYRRGR